jgi:cyanophycin synthetase
VGLTTTDAVYSNGHLVVKGDMTGPAAARMVLRDPDVDAAVLETARGGLVRRGLGYDAVDVGACLNVTSDHLGLGGIDTLEQLAQVKSTVVRVARNVAVLNADDTYCRSMADGLQAKEILWVTMESPSEAVQAHVAAGGKAVALEPGDHDSEEIVIYDQCRRMPLIKTRLIPATLEGKAVHNVQNAMFAVAMVYSVGKSLDTIRQGLRTFDSNFFQTPGRMNIFDEHPFRTILDYGHNEAAVRAMVQTVEKMAPRGKKHVVVTCPGDRRDEDVLAIANQLAGHFDSYICYTEDNPRDRDAGQVGAMLDRALQDAGVAAEAITVVPLEPEAVQMGLERSQPDDLLLVFGEAISRTWKQSSLRRPPDRAARACGNPRHNPASGFSSRPPQSACASPSGCGRSAGHSCPPQCHASLSVH